LELVCSLFSVFPPELRVGFKLQKKKSTRRRLPSLPTSVFAEPDHCSLIIHHFHFSQTPLSSSTSRGVKMAETLTPNTNPTTNQRQRPPMAARLQSPTSPFLGSNDDQLERAQARAARAAAFRRKPVDIRPPSRPSLSSTSCLDREQIIELFHNCVKLASENVSL